MREEEDGCESLFYDHLLRLIFEMMDKHRFALLLSVLLCCLLLQPSGAVAGFRGGARPARLSTAKLPRDNPGRLTRNSALLKQNARKSNKDRVAVSYNPSPGLNPAKALGKLLDPGSIVFHAAPSILFIALSRATRSIDFSSIFVTNFARISVVAYLLITQALFWSLRRVIRASADETPIDLSPKSLMDMLGALSGKAPASVAHNVMEYDLGEVDRLQSGMAVEASLYIVLMMLRCASTANVLPRSDTVVTELMYCSFL